MTRLQTYGVGLSPVCQAYAEAIRRKDSESSRIGLVRALSAAGRVEEAQEACQSALRRFPQNRALEHERARLGLRGAREGTQRAE